MKPAEEQFRDDTDAMHRLAWLLWTSCKPSTAGSWPIRSASVQQLREAAQAVWRETGRRVTNGSPGLRGLPARINAALNSLWIENTYETQLEQRNNYTAANYYRLRFEPPETAPLRLFDDPGPRLFDATGTTAGDPQLAREAEKPAAACGESMRNPEADAVEITTAEQLEQFHRDALAVARILAQHQGPIRNTLTRSALLLALELSKH